MADFFEKNDSKPQVTVTSPLNNSTVSSPVHVQAAASPSPGHTISGWVIYVDSVNVYSAGAVTSINTNVNMTSGKHTVIVRAWDTSGAYGDQTLTITVTTNKPTVTVSTPSNNSTVWSPTNLKASATPSSGQKICGWWVYVDSIGVYSAGSVNNINTYLKMAPGAHQIVVRAWDTSGAYGDQTINVTVNKLTVTVSLPTQGATVVSPINIQATGKCVTGKWISKWWVYLDNVEVYHAGAVGKININIPASTGSHTLKVEAQDSGGDTAQQVLTVTVK